MPAPTLELYAMRVRTAPAITRVDPTWWAPGPVTGCLGSVPDPLDVQVLVGGRRGLAHPTRVPGVHDELHRRHGEAIFGVRRIVDERLVVHAVDIEADAAWVEVEPVVVVAGGGIEG